MRIAQLAPPWIKVPPQSYGGIEWVVALLCDQLVARGHDVTLFASGDSDTAAELRAVFEEAQTEKLGETLPDALHVSTALRCADEFDIIHDHSGFLGVAMSPFVKTPMLHTLHGPFTHSTRRFYGEFADACFYNAISEYQRSRMPSLRYVDTVHNAVDVRGYPFRTDKEDFALTIGRICADKAQHLAIRAARAAGMRILLAGKIDPGADFVYFQTMVEPLLGDDAEYLGEVPEARKRELMARARCFLFPIQWAEPFGLVMAEAMAAGTPVIATRNGAVPEVVVDGVTGFIVDDTEEMIERLLRIDEIDPGACRAHVEASFSPERMAAGYERNYETIVRKTAETGPEVSPGRRVTTQGGPAYASICGSVSKSASAPARAGGARLVGGHRNRYRRDNLPDSPSAG